VCRQDPRLGTSLKRSHEAALPLTSCSFFSQPASSLREDREAVHWVSGTTCSDVRDTQVKLRAYPNRLYFGYPVGKNCFARGVRFMRHEPENVRRIGGCPTTCGSASSRCSRPGSRTRWGATGHASMIAGRWRPSSSSFARGANGTQDRTRASVPVAGRIAASKSGQQPGSSWPSGSKAWLCTKPCRVLTGSGWPWTGR